MADCHLSEKELKDIFNEFDLDGNGHINCAEIGEVMKALGEDQLPDYKLREIVAEIETGFKNGKIEFNEFLEFYKKNSKFSAGKQFRNLIKKKALIETSGGTSESSTEGTKHSYSEAERVAFVDWINTQLAEDPDVKAHLPLDPDKDTVFQKMKDGIILCKMINLSVPGTIDERAINKPQAGKTLDIYKRHENLILALNSAKSIGCYIINIGADDLDKGKPHLMLGVLWQIIRIGLFANMSSQMTTDGLLSSLPFLEGEENFDDLSPEDLLLNWFNWHLKNANCDRPVENFSEDIMDCECYTILLQQISPEEKKIEQMKIKPMQEKDDTKRAEKMLEMADIIGCKKFVRPTDVVSGNSKLNMAFVANLYNDYPGLDAKATDAVSDAAAADNQNSDETKEEKTFRNWMNSIGVDPFVNRLYKDLRNGLVLLQIYDIIKPNTVIWAPEEKKVNQSFKEKGKKMMEIENCNYAVEIGTETAKYSLPGVRGHHIQEGHETYTLAIVWQQMRAYTLALLSKLTPGGETMDNKKIIELVNKKLNSKGKKTIKGLCDPVIATSLPVLDLVDAIKPNVVNNDMVSSDPTTDEEKLSNAKYALSVARKIGATTYALPDDLVEVKPKMVLTVFACLMATSLELEKNKPDKKK